MKHCRLKLANAGMVKGRGWYRSPRSIRIMARIESSPASTVRSLFQHPTWLRRWRAS